MDKYSHPLLLSYVGQGMALHYKIGVFNAIGKSLVNHYEIMSLRWDTLERKWFGEQNNFCLKVHQYGWDHDDDTRRLRQMFMSVFTPVFDKRLEDYL